MASPLVSIVLPTYNGESYLAESLTSCIQQTYKHLEIVVVVDGSTDNTDEVLKGFDDPRLKVVRKANGGLPRALNTGFANATGDYFTWTSDDNFYHAQAIERMVATLEQAPHAPMVSADYFVIDDKGKRVGYSRRYVACFLYRASVARSTGEYRWELPLVEDTDYWYRLQHHGGAMLRLHEPLYSYRVHGGSLSSRRAGERARREAEMLLDLHQSGVLTSGVRRKLLNCMREASLYKSWDELNVIGEMIDRSAVGFAPTGRYLGAALQTLPGWLLVRTASFAIGRASVARDLAKRHREGTLWL